MAGRGPAPKPVHLRQRTNRKAGASMLTVPDRPKVPEIPNPDGRAWHPFTLEEWREACQSPMATQWLPSDWRGVARLAVLWDEFYKNPGNLDVMKEIRLQSPGYGLNPLDRSRLQWEVARTDEVVEKRQKAKQEPSRPAADPRKVLMMAVK